MDRAPFLQVVASVHPNEASPDLNVPAFRGTVLPFVANVASFLLNVAAVLVNVADFFLNVPALDLCRFRKFCGLFSGNPADSGSVQIVAS
jgi:hypothetical protein